MFATLLALETVAVVGFALGLKGLTPSPRWCRVIWHCCFLALGLLLLAAGTGVGRRFVVWVNAAGPRAATREMEPVMSDTRGDSKISPSEGSVVGGYSKIDEHRSRVSPVSTGLAGAGTTIPATQVFGGEPAVHRSGASVTPMNGGGEPAVRLPMIDEPLVDTKEHSLTDNLAAQAGLAPVVPSVALSRDRGASPASGWFEVSDAWWGALWGIGVTIVLLRVGLARFLSMMFQLRRQPFPDAGLRARVQVLGLRLGYRRTIGVLASPRLLGPVAMGLARPAIVLPSDFATRFSAAQQEAMLAHEVAHLAVHDPAWHFLADGVAALLWWHPLIWRARRELHRASEHAADEASLLIENGPRVLAECLVALGAQRGRRWPAVELGVEGQGFRSGLGRRVERLLHLGGQAWRPLNPARSGVVKTTVPIVVAALAILSAAWAVPQALTQGDPMTKLQQTWKRSLAAVTVAVSLGTEPSSSRIAAQTTPATPTAAAEEKAAATPESSTPAPAAAAENAAVPVETPDQAAPSKESPPVRPAMSAEMMRRYGLTPTSAQSSPSEEVPPVRPAMSVEMMRRYGLTPTAPANAKSGMSAEMMRRYGIAPRVPISASDDIAPAPPDAETIRRLEESRFETLMEYTRMNTLYTALSAKEGPLRRVMISTVWPNQNLDELQRRFAQAQRELAGLTNDFGPDHPDVKRAQAVLARINQQVDIKVDAIMEGMKERLASVKDVLDRTVAMLDQARTNDAGRGTIDAAFATTSETIRRMESSRLGVLNEYSRMNSLYKGLLAMERAVRRNAISTAWPDDNLAELERRLAQAQQELATLTTDFSPEHRSVKRAQGVLAMVDRQIDTKVDAMMDGIKERVASAKAAFDQTTATLEDARSKVSVNRQANLQPGMSAAMMRRYGLTPGATPATQKDESAAEGAGPSEPDNVEPGTGKLNRARLQRKLETLHFDQIAFPDGMLLGQAVQMLADEVRKQDPEGINWVISQVAERDSRPIDPATGLPASDARCAGAALLLAPAAGDVALHVSQPLRGLKLKDVLDVITKVAEWPIRYTVENYGVVFALGNPVREPAKTPEEPRPSLSAAMMARYGLTPTPEAAAPPATEAPASRLRAKSEQIIFPEFRLPHGMNLSDAVKYLDDETRKQDPEKKGVNFVLTRIVEGTAGQPGLDPTTGLPVPATPAIGEMSVRGGLELRRVSLKDVLEALTKVVDAPIRCDFLPYGVVISPASSPASGLAASRASRIAKPVSAVESRLVSRAFQLDKRHFLPRLKATFGIAAGEAGESTVESGAAGAGASQSSTEYNPNAEDVRAAVVKLAEHLGVTFRNPSKEVFYNLETGMLMLRATGEDLETMAAAMETLSDGDKAKNVKF